jgi:hypothetical protein
MSEMKTSKPTSFLLEIRCDGPAECTGRNGKYQVGYITLQLNKDGKVKMGFVSRKLHRQINAGAEFPAEAMDYLAKEWLASRSGDASARSTLEGAARCLEGVLRDLKGLY